LYRSPFVERVCQGGEPSWEDGDAAVRDACFDLAVRPQP